MKILVKICANNDLACYEALSLAFALASFDHQIDLYLGDYICQVLHADPTGKLAKMLSALPLYDISPAFVPSEYFATLPKTLICLDNMCCFDETTNLVFETVFEL